MKSYRYMVVVEGSEDHCMRESYFHTKADRDEFLGFILCYSDVDRKILTSSNGDHIYILCN